MLNLQLKVHIDVKKCSEDEVAHGSPNDLVTGRRSYLNTGPRV